MKDALMIIDMQKDVVNKMLTFAKDVVPKVSSILKAYRKAGKPVVHLVRVHRPDGSDVDKFRVGGFEERPYLVRGTEGVEILDELTPLEGEYVVEKQRFSGFLQTNMDLILRRLGVDTLVIAGVQTPNCVRATAVDAVSLDYDVIVLSDATKSKTEETQNVNLEDMENMGIRIRTVEEQIRVLRVK